MAIIFANSIFLAAYDYTDRDEKHLRNKIINLAGVIFTIFFTIECIFKVIAFGFVFHYKAYLRNGWNWLDLIVVIVGWIELIPSTPSIRGLRTLRVLRPLRSIN
jgi:voltage-dependent calcium channel L type alpha-1D